MIRDFFKRLWNAGIWGRLALIFLIIVLGRLIGVLLYAAFGL